MPIDPMQAKPMGEQGFRHYAAGSGVSGTSPMEASGTPTIPVPMVPERRAQQAQLLMQQQEQPSPAPSSSSSMGLPSEQAAGLRDRITKMLADATRDMTPLETFAQVGRAASRAATSDVTFGDALNSMNAQRMAAAQQMSEFLRGERQLALQEQEGARADKRLAVDILNSDRTFSLEERRFAKAVADSDRGFDLETRRFAEEVENNKQNYSLEIRKLAQQVLSDERNFQLSREDSDRAGKRLAHDIMASDRAFSQEERRFAQAVADSDRAYDLQTKQFAETVLSNKRNYSLETQKLARHVVESDREHALATDKQAYDQLVEAAKMGQADAAAVTDALNRLVPEAQRATYAQKMEELPYEVDGSNVTAVIGRVRRDLEAAGDLPPVADGDDAKARAIERTMRANPGTTYREAQGIVDGIIDRVVDPVTGNVSLVNTLTGSQRVLSPTLPPAQQPTPAPEGETLTDLANTGAVAGIAPWLRATADRIFGQVPGYPVDTQLAETRQIFVNESRNLVRALQTNPRFSEGERSAIARSISLEPEVFQSREGFLSRMVANEKTVRRLLENEARAAADPSLPSEVRQGAAATANAARNFLAILGDPDEGLRVGKGGVVSQGSGLTPDEDALVNRWLQ